MVFRKKSQKGFTIVEALIGLTIFMIIAVSLYQTFLVLTEAQRLSRLKIIATALANEQFEVMRNLPYADVGIINGIPNGKIPHTQTLERNGTSFTVETVIRNIDDPFDGTIGGSPNDLSPADYKLAALSITCATCAHFQPLSFTTYVGPRGLETASTNGALFVRALNAVGEPVSGANVHIVNNGTNPPITIDDTTNNDGYLQIVDVPPGVEAYEITVGKNGYSTEKTYTVGLPANPNPLMPHATVALQQLTQISFAIDQVSTINVSSIDQTCGPVSSIDFSLSGSKLIGTNPDVIKYTASYVTDANGQKAVTNLEWDDYSLVVADVGYDLAGTIPLLPLHISPNTNQDLKLIVVPMNPNSLLVTIKDTSTQLPISGADVRLERINYDMTLITGRGFITQTDWSGGDQQETVGDITKYATSDGNVETNNPTGELQLIKDGGGIYQSSGYLISSTFDTGSPSNFHQILWQPISQSPDVGSDSVRFHIATNNDNTTWNFVGPDGTENTFYTLANQNISSTHHGTRYFRYKVFLQTENTDYTPIISDVSFTFTSSCVPPGQVIFDTLDPGSYTVTVSKTGYQTVVDTVNISSAWQQKEVVLSP